MRSASFPPVLNSSAVWPAPIDLINGLLPDDAVHSREPFCVVILIVPSALIRSASPSVVLNDNCCELCSAEIVAIPAELTWKSNLLSEVSDASSLKKGWTAFIETNLLYP